MRRVGVLATALLMGLSSVASGADDVRTSKSGPKPIEVKVPSRKEPVSYANDVLGILEDKCVGCHGSALAENKLSLEDIPAMLKGGKKGPALVPGKADESLLFRMAAHRVEPVMPPKDKPGNSPLSSEELGLLKLWIDAGAKDDSAEHAGEAKAKAPEDRRPGRAPSRRPPGRRRGHDRQRGAGRGGAGQRGPGLRRRLGARDRHPRRPQGPDPVAPVQPRRQPAGRGELPDRHPLDGADGLAPEDTDRPRRPGAGDRGLGGRQAGVLGRPGQDDPGLGPGPGETGMDREPAGPGDGPGDLGRRQDALCRRHADGLDPRPRRRRSPRAGGAQGTHRRRRGPRRASPPRARARVWSRSRPTAPDASGRSPILPQPRPPASPPRSRPSPRRSSSSGHKGPVRCRDGHNRCTGHHHRGR